MTRRTLLSSKETRVLVREIYAEQKNPPPAAENEFHTRNVTPAPFFYETCLAIWHPQWFKLTDSEVSHLKLLPPFSSMATYLLLFASPLLTPTKTTTSFPEQSVQKRSAC